MQWSENVAGKGKTPELKDFVTLIDPPAPLEYATALSESDLTGPTHATRIWIDDVNSDGKLDILVGDNLSLVSPAEGLSKEEFQEKLDEYVKKSKEAAKLMAAANADSDARQKARQEFSKLYSSRSHVYDRVSGPASSGSICKGKSNLTHSIAQNHASARHGLRS